MKNKVVVTIGGKDYTMVAVEDEEYVRRCAALVDQQIQQISHIICDGINKALIF